MEVYKIYLIGVAASVISLIATIFNSNGILLFYIVSSLIVIVTSIQLSIAQHNKYNKEVINMCFDNGKINEPVVSELNAKYKKIAKVSLRILVIEAVLSLYPFVFMSYPVCMVFHKMGIWMWRFSGHSAVNWLCGISLIAILLEIWYHSITLKSSNYAMGLATEHRKILKMKEDLARSMEEEKAKKEAKKKEYRKQMSLFTSQYGSITKTIRIHNGVQAINNEIHVFESSKHIAINGNIYSFNDILSCTFTDSPRTIKGKITSETKTRTGSTLGRAIVGDIVAGPAGAIIGGSTAKKDTVYHQEEDKVVHDYTVIINVNSLTCPVIRISTGDNGTLTNEIVGLMNVVIMRK